MDCQECVMSLRRESMMNSSIPERCDVESILNCRFKSAVLDRFPLTDHADTALPPQICMFALPEGVTLKQTCPLPTYYVVVFTSNEVDIPPAVAKVAINLKQRRIESEFSPGATYVCFRTQLLRTTAKIRLLASCWRFR
jgi:hypothetical protein